MREHHHPNLGTVDVYPVGVLASLLAIRRAITVPGPSREFRVRTIRNEAARIVRTIRREIADRDWHALRNSFNGYLAEPRTFPAHMRRCGHAWTRRRALRDLDQHHRERSS